MTIPNHDWFEKVFKKWSKTHVSNRCTLLLAVTKLVVRKITSAIQRVEASQVVIHNFFSNSKYSISSRVNRARDTVRLANVHWSFRTQNSRSKNVFLKSSYPKSSWILINPESFPRCKLQRNNKREVLELRKPLVGPFGFWMHKNSEFWKKIPTFSKFWTHGNFKCTKRFCADMKFISKIFWTRIQCICKLLRDVCWLME